MEQRKNPLKNKNSTVKKQSEKAIGVQWGEESENQVDTFFYLKSNLRIVATALHWMVLSWRRIVFFNSFFHKFVSFIWHIEDLSALDAPLIDSINWKRVAANKSFFVSWRQLGNRWISQAENDHNRRAHPHHTSCFFPSSKKTLWSASNTIISKKINNASFVLLQTTLESFSVDMWTQIAIRMYAARVRKGRETRVVYACYI